MTLNLSLEDAIIISCNHIYALDYENIHIKDAFKRVSAREIISGLDVPSFDRSLMDGYVISAADLLTLQTGESLPIKVVDIIPAGSIESRQIKAGEAYRIMTGALVPEGSAAVIKQEDVLIINNDNTIVVCGARKMGENICLAGNELKAGKQVAAKGQFLTGEVLEKVATCGIDTICVYKKPRVSVIDTGSELLLPGFPMQKGQIYASSRSLLSSKILNSGGIPFIPDYIVKDDLEAIAQAIEEAAHFSDMVIITGGTGKGVYDLVYKTFEYLSAQPLFRGIKIIPGQGSAAAILHNKLVYNVSGNPHAAGLLFEALIKPALQKLSGNLSAGQDWFSVKLGSPLKVIKPIRNLCQGEMIFDRGDIYARPIKKSGNYIVKNPLILDIQAGQGATGDIVQAKFI